MILIGASTGWDIGLVLGIIVVVVAAAIVITIVMLARKIAKQARTAVEGVEKVREQTDGARRDRADQRLGRPDPALGARAAKGGGGQMTAARRTLQPRRLGDRARDRPRRGARRRRPADRADQAVGDIKRSVGALLEVAGKVAGNTANIPQLEATAPVLGLIVEEAVIQDGYMNALTDGFGNGNGDR